MYQWILVAAISNPWAHQITPSAGSAEAIGGYAAGCLQGAVALPEHGTGYQILRPRQKRFYGHPVMEQYVLDLARQARKMGLPDILVGDMAMAKGGLQNSLSDAGVGALCARTAVYGAYFNVRINAKDIKNRDTAKKLLNKAKSIFDKTLTNENEMIALIDEKI